jgi:ATP-binding cassette subfamily B protein
VIRACWAAGAFHAQTQFPGPSDCRSVSETQLQSYLTGHAPLIWRRPIVAQAVRPHWHPIRKNADLHQGHAHASAWTLFRLTLHKPTKRQCCWVYFDAIKGTAASLVPPATIPLMDEVLIPFQNGQHIDLEMALYLSAGLFGSAFFSLGGPVLGQNLCVGAGVRHRLRTTLTTTCCACRWVLWRKRTGDDVAHPVVKVTTFTSFLSLHRSTLPLTC